MPSFDAKDSCASTSFAAARWSLPNTLAAGKRLVAALKHAGPAGHQELSFRSLRRQPFHPGRVRIAWIA